ncbi:cache domain-containing sensor histidine kinase [Paenibacillus cremeus]|uniref:Sensor histidine kinase n=1 Tax=Paenibacillus cremeus TaxID=2163881 RepID=A0A559KAU3_9BACL|nr:sensor histidine kinase [Paenibacillus cremeus]TVY09245.1 sensor histidine kinase [Paenibacillus cremeus]
MNTNLFGFTQFVKNRLLLKLVLVYSTFMLVPLLLTIYIITGHVNAKMIELEIGKQDELTNKMSAYLEEEYAKIRSIVYWFYNSEAPTTVDMLINSAKNDSAFPPYIIKNRISSELDKVVLWDKEILDIILIDRNKQVFSTSRRSVSVGYDFTNKAPLSGLETSDKTMYKRPYTHPDYILAGNVPVISNSGNLYDLNHLPDDRSVGQFIINLSLDEIMKQYRQLAGTSRAAMYVFDDDGTVLFSSDTQALGLKYPFLNETADLSLASHELKLNGEPYIINKSELSEKGLHMIVQTPKTQITRETNRLIRQILFIFFCGVFIVLLLTLLFSTNIASRIKRLLTAMRSVEKGRFDTRVAFDSRDELGQLASAFNRMCLRLEEHVDMVYLAEIKTKSAELSALQSRINPHFLLNTMESIRMVAVRERKPEIADMLYTLGKLFRWKIRSTDLIVSVEEELEYISSYLYLMQFRYQDQLAVSIHMDETMYELGIPKLLLQPIIENASEHGLFQKAQQARLSIRGYRREQDVIFDIIDNGVGMDAVQLQELTANMEEAAKSLSQGDQIGLSNVQQRIRLLFGKPYGLTIASRKDHWTRVRVTIPAISWKEMDALVQDFYR